MIEGVKLVFMLRPSLCRERSTVGSTFVQIVLQVVLVLALAQSVAWAQSSDPFDLLSDEQAMQLDELMARSRQLLAEEAWADALEILRVPTNDAWVRDYGPLVAFGAGGKREAIVWRFDSWGGKYPPWDADERAAAALARAAGLEVVETGIVLEGGSIDVDGCGTLLTTESCLLRASRNPDLDRDAIEAALERYLGAGRVLWLGDGIEGDDTDGHIDDLTRFVRPGTVVTAIETEPNDANYRALRENRDRLQGMTAADGARLEVVELPMPEPVRAGGMRCPASYANFYVGNRLVLVPTYGSSRDAVALEILADLFPGREVVGIDCRDVVLGLGALHCVLLPLPAARGGESRADVDWGEIPLVD